MLPANSDSQNAKRSNELSMSFRRSAAGREVLQVRAPETDLSVDSVNEFRMRMEAPPPRFAPPGHESFVSLASVKDDPNQVIINCEDQCEQERLANLAEVNKAISDDVNTVYPNEDFIGLASRDVNLQTFINKCLRVSVKHTKSVSRNTRLQGLRSLRAQGKDLIACASSNLESEDEDFDSDDSKND